MSLGEFGNLLAGRPPVLLFLILSLFPAGRAYSQQDQADPLPSWNNGPAKQAIHDFVRVATDKSNPHYLPPEQRIATFDQDGTLWVEQPLYTQALFAFDRVKALAPRHPEWKTHEPFQAILSGDRAAMAKFALQDFERVLAETHSGITVDEFATIVKEWLSSASHPRFQRPFTQLVYQPMLEVMKYFRARGFKTYIVTAGGQEFVRTYAETVYGVPPEQVIGSRTGRRNSNMATTAGRCW